MVRNKHPKKNFNTFMIPSSVGPDVVPPVLEGRTNKRKTTVIMINKFKSLLNMHQFIHLYGPDEIEILLFHPNVCLS